MLIWDQNEEKNKKASDPEKKVAEKIILRNLLAGWTTQLNFQKKICIHSYDEVWLCFKKSKKSEVFEPRKGKGQEVSATD